MKRIVRVAKGEKVVVPIMSEDLQEKFDKMCLKADDYRRVKEEISETDKDEKEKLAELHKRKTILDYESEQAYSQFWYDCKMKYGLHAISIGVRDGYCLVLINENARIQAMKEIKGMIIGTGLPDELIQMIKKMIDNGEGPFGNG